MRDPKRIDRILYKLGIIWKEKPDLRLNQMMQWIAVEYGGHPTLSGDLFFFDDNRLEEALDKAMEQN